MNIKAKILFLIMTLLTVTPFLFSQNNYLDEVRIENSRVEQRDNRLSVDMDIILDDLRLLSNDIIEFTPLLVSNDGEIVNELPSVVVAGKRRSKILERSMKLNNSTGLDTEPYEIVRRRNNTAQKISYSTDLPIAAWKEDASLGLRRSILSCANCDMGGDFLVLLPRIIPEAYVPSYKLTYIVPEVEVKTLSDRHTAMFNFVVDRWELIRDFKNNAAEFNEVDRVIDEIRNNRDFEITEFEITGYASPEAPVDHNKMLAQNRANAFADYIVSKFGINRSSFNVNGHGEDWDGLRKAVESSSLSDRQAILNIIDNVSNPDARDAELKKLSNGQTYRNLLNNFYPLLRRTEYVIAYNVRPFDVEEAREVIKTNPRLLSLNEMYLVAQSYPVGSTEFKEVFDIATRHYPDSDIAILNSSSADIEVGNIDAAIERMNKISDNPKVWNNLGVAHALNGDLDTAEEYFNKAASSGDDDARTNLEELTKVNRN